MSEPFNRWNVACRAERHMGKKLPSGVSGFRTLAGGDYHFVDKSLMIEDLIQLGEGPCLFTRPRRFGKTMNLSMLDAFFENGVPDGKELFSGLKISGCPEAMEHLGKYKVFRLNFADIESADLELFFDLFSLMMSDLYLTFDHLSECERISEAEREQFMAICRRDADEELLIRSVSLLSRWVKIAYGMDVVILIDEYDKPIHMAYQMGYYTEIAGFFSRFMESSFNGNECCRFAVLTGVSTISEESVYSGIVGLKRFDIFQPRFDGSFGFTEEEVGTLISDTGMPPEELDTIRKHYGGYRFGNQEVCNPFSVIRHIQGRIFGEARTKCHWANSGGSVMISDALCRAEPSFRDRILALADPGASLVCDISPNLSIGKLHSLDEDELEESTVTLLAISGYLTAVPCDGGRYAVSIPNLDVSEGYREMVSDVKSEIRTAPRH